MSIVVSKCSPEVVCPSEPTPTGNIHLSSFDKDAGPIPVSSLLVFEKPIVDPVETMRRALSQALVHYYPVSGRLAPAAGPGSECEVITCCGEGVLFVGATASCAVDEVLSSPAPSGLLSDLLVVYPEEVCGPTDPLLLMQVTEFWCGGFVVGVTWNHAVADGTGIGQLLQAVGELARGMPVPSIFPPVRSDPSVLAACPPVSPVDLSAAELTEGMAFLDFTVPSSLIGRVKAVCACTAFEAVGALLWRCRARAVSADDKRPGWLTLVCNVRGLVGSNARGYYGNCILKSSVSAADVAHRDIGDVVKLIKSAKCKIEEKMKKKKNPAAAAEDIAPHQLGYHTFLVSSWRNIGLEAPDFGSGGAARVMWYAEQSLLPYVD